jgi:two-component system LytT family response regulator
MLRAILVDDERNALELLKLQLETVCPEVLIQCLCESGAEAVEAIGSIQPDLVFMDIEMPVMNGFDVLRKTEGVGYDVVFTTAYDQFALQAFRFAAIDYLLKPIDMEELKQAVVKVKQRRSASTMEDRFAKLLDYVDKSSPSLRKVALPIGDALHLVGVDEIIRCESDSNYTHVFLKNGKKVTVTKTLKDIEESLQGDPFYRIHQSHLVNTAHVVKVVKGDGGYVVMSDGSQLSVSRAKKDGFFEQFIRL